MNVAIIGSGISGLSAAYELLAAGVKPTLYERDVGLGGHSMTLAVESEVRGRRVTVPVNPAFDIFNKVHYPRYTALLDRLRIPYEAREFSYTYCCVGGRRKKFRWMLPTFLNVRNAAQLLQPAYLRFAATAARLGREIERYEYQPRSNLTWHEFLRQHGVGDEHIEDFMFPVLARPWGMKPPEMREMPTEIVVHWLAVHRPFTPRPVPWLSIVGGAGRASAAMADHLRRGGAQFRTGAPIVGIVTEDASVEIELENGQRERFDHVIFATNAQQALALLRKPTPAQAEALGGFRYERNHVVVHSDRRLMPRHRMNWSYFNLRYDRDQQESYNSIWFGQALGADVFATNYRTLPIDPIPALVHARYTYEQPVMNAAAMRARSKLRDIQGQRGLWFAGVYTRGTAHHEDGLVSAADVVARLTQQVRTDDVWT